MARATQVVRASAGICVAKRVALLTPPLGDPDYQEGKPDDQQIEPGMIHHLDSGPLLPAHGLLHAASPFNRLLALNLANMVDASASIRMAVLATSL